MWRPYCVKGFSFPISFNIQPPYDVATHVIASAQGHNPSGRTGTQTQDFDSRTLVHTILLNAPSQATRFWLLPGLGSVPLLGNIVRCLSKHRLPGDHRLALWRKKRRTRSFPQHTHSKSISCKPSFLQNKHFQFLQCDFIHHSLWKYSIATIFSWYWILAHVVDFALFITCEPISPKS